MSKAFVFIKTPLCFAFCLLIGCGRTTSEGGPVRLHPENGHYFEFRGKPVVLVGSTEHYAAVMNLDFNYVRYLDEVRACGLNLVRVFTGVYRQYPGFVVENSPLNVQPGRFIAPWPRSNVPGESDGGNKFDLSKWDPAYFHRLTDFVRTAGERGIVVEVTLFCPFYHEVFPTDPDKLWRVSPMKASNHINGVGAGNGESCYTVTSDLLPYHKALTRKIAAELKTFDNVYFEIMNEPYYGAKAGWEDQIINELVAAEATLPADQRHLIARNVANSQQVITQPNPAISIYNFHYSHPNAALLNQGLNRAIGNDETGALGTADFPYRREAWEFFMAGGAVENHLDYSFTPEREDGMDSPKKDGGGGSAIRRQLGVLKWFFEELPLLRCSPKTGFVTAGVPTGGAASAFGSTGEAYGLYVRGGTQANLTVNLPAGTYRGRWIDPRSGKVTATVAEFTHAGGSKALASPVYTEDAALMLFGGSSPPPKVTLSSPVYQSVAAKDSSITLTAAAEVVNGSVARVEFLSNDVVVGTDSTAPYSMVLSGMSEGNRNFRARVVASDGRTSVSVPVKCLVIGHYHSGVNLNGNMVNLHGHDWTSGAEAFETGTVLTNFQNTSASPTQTLYPVPDPPTRELIADRIVRAADHEQMTVAHPLPDGTYDVFICLTEGAVGFTRDVRVAVEDIVVAQGIGHLAANEWVNCGPYRTTVTGGTLNIDLQDETKGNPMIANFSIYETEPPPTLAEAELKIRNTSGFVILSWPPSVPAGMIEFSSDLGINAAWQPLTQPAADFGDRMEVAIPTTASKQFFRIRKN